MPKRTVPIADKFLLTIEEASEYFSIGESKMRSIVQEHECDLVLKVGVKCLVKKHKMEEFFDTIESI